MVNQAVKAHREKRIVISAVCDGKRYNLFQIMRGKNDGSIYINFPYFKHAEGLVSVATISAGHDYPKNVALAPGGRVTSHLVKYSHHPDGRAHFSQDGKVLTEIKKESETIANIDGHFFTAEFTGLPDFRCESIDSPSKAGKLNLDLAKWDSVTDTIKVVAHLYSKKSLMSRAVNMPDSIGPTIPVKTSSDKLEYAFLIGGPVEQEDEKLIMIKGEAVHRSYKSGNMLTFIGGFDSLNVVNNYEVPTSFLAFAYPVDDYESLKQQIGSIDFIKP